MTNKKYLVWIVLIVAAFLFIFTGCGEPVEPDEHIGPEEEEEMDENSEDDGYGMLNQVKVEALLL